MARRKPGANISTRLRLELEAVGESVQGGASLLQRWTWELGAPTSGVHDDGHVSIAATGHVFTGPGLEGEDLRIRAGDSGSWPFVDPRYIGDHNGCVCWKNPILEIPT